jgi:hypothetical protein
MANRLLRRTGQILWQEESYGQAAGLVANAEDYL